MVTLFTIPLISFFTVLLLTPPIGKLAKKWGMVDHPSERKIHHDPVPLMGGLAIYLGFLPSVLSTLDYNHALLGVLCGGSLIMVTGLIDDKFHLSASLKLIIQIMAALILIKSGIVIKVFHYQFLNLFFTIFGVIGITNAVNFLDNMDGLAAGLIAIGCYTYFIISLFTDQKWLGYLSLALGTSCVAFLFYNFKPAKIFMGDAGSTFLGFNLAALSIMGSWAYNVFVAVSVPLLVLFIPIFDTTLITILRIKEGKVKTVKQWIEYADTDHFSHRIVGLGFTEKASVLLIYLLVSFLGAMAVLIQRFENTFLTICVWVVVLTIFFILGKILSRVSYPNR